MGEVWLAEQEVPVRRKVALKIVKLGRFNRGERLSVEFREGPDDLLAAPQRRLLRST